MRTVPVRRDFHASRAIARRSLQSSKSAGREHRSSHVLHFAALLSAILGLQATFFPGRTAASDGEADLKTIQSAVESYANSIHSLTGRVTVRVTPSQHTSTLHPAALVMEDWTEVIDFEYDLARGRTFEDARASWIYGDFSQDRFEKRVIRTFDGEHRFALLHTLTKDPVDVPIPTEVPHKLHIFAGAGPQVGYSLPNFVGLPVRGFDMSLAGLVRSRSARLYGRETVAGSSCYRISVERPDGRLVVWLDPKHDFLPKRQEFTRLPADRKPPYHNNEILEVIEFGRFPMQDGGSRWFPIRVTARTWIDTTVNYEVVTLQINPVLQPERFQVDPESLPEGVQVRRDGTLSYTGGRHDLWQERERLLDEHSRIIREKLGRPPVGRRARHRSAEQSERRRAQFLGRPG